MNGSWELKKILMHCYLDGMIVLYSKELLSPQVWMIFQDHINVKVKLIFKVGCISSLKFWQKYPKYMAKVMINTLPTLNSSKTTSNSSSIQIILTEISQWTTAFLFTLAIPISCPSHSEFLPLDRINTTQPLKK